MMKRLLFLLAYFIPALCLMAESNRPIVSGRVVMTDGERFDFPTIFFPDYTDVSLLASEDIGYHNSLTLFNANDVLYFDFWLPDTPDKVHRLYSVRLKHQPRQVAHYWALMDIQTPYGFVVMAYPRYVLQEDGSLEGVTLYGNRAFSYPRVFALHYGQEYYDTWPLNLDSKILNYLNRDGDHAPGPSGTDIEMLFDNGFDAGDFFDISDMELGF